MITSSRHPLLTHSLSLVLLITMISASGMITPHQAVAQAGPLLTIEGPTQVEIGEPITFVLRSRGVAAIGGYEAAMLFDTNVAEFHLLEQRDKDLTRLFGRDIEPVAAIGLPYGAAVGLASCPVADCVVRRGPRRGDPNGNGTELASVSIVAYQPGTLEVRFDAIKIVLANGIALPIPIPAKAFTIQVGPSGTGQHYPAPAVPWNVPRSATGAMRPFDITGNGSVTYSDVMEVAIAWQTAREAGTPCSDLPDAIVDINQDGCVDIADLQLIASQYTLAGTGEPSIQGASADAADETHTLQQSANRTYVVNATGDASDAVRNGTCATSTGACTLRAAIQEANNDGGASRIEFRIPGSGVKTIKLTKPLPTLSDESGPTTINGYTQPGSSPNTHGSVSNAQITVQIEGKGEDRFRGIAITTPGNVIRGMAWYRFNRAFYLNGRNATGNVFVGNFLGTNAAGSYKATKRANAQAHTVTIQQGARQNRVGGTNIAERNVISGGGRTGVSMWHGGTIGNTVVNNLIGLRPNGNACLANRGHGVDINHGASNNTVGGNNASQRNVITGNATSGTDISHSTATTGNQVLGNYIGTNVSGNGAVPNCTNQRVGIRLKDGVRNNLINGNVIGRNRQAGIEIQSPPMDDNNATTTQNTFTNNRIGVSANGSAIANPIGMLINGRRNQIGPGNIIARNTGPGIRLHFAVSDSNTITRNSTYNNGGLGIDLAPNGVTPNDAGDGDGGPNDNLNFPVIGVASRQSVSGRACGGCRVEVFVADSGTGQHGEGRTFVGSGTAASNGNFTVNVSGVPSSAIVTATATDSSGNTSEFSRNVRVN